MKITVWQRQWLLIVTMLALGACAANDEQAASSEPVSAAPAGVFAQMFEWRWNDIAEECENVLGPAGYAAVQISPPNEHIAGPAWWTRYQPVSYKIESRGGTREEFADMVTRCADAGVDIYADALTNHMAGFEAGTGVAGSPYSEFNYPVPYGYDDFHHCGRYDDDRIRDYQDLWEVQNCQLGTLDDLDTGKPAVQAKIAAYLNDLLSLGVAGFRMDAVKHVAHDEVTEILQQVEGDPFVFQEVIDHGGEPIDATNYIENGMVTEFKFPPVIVEAFEHGNPDALTNFSSHPGWLPADQAIVFVDNHDLQRGHAGGAVIVNYKDGERYDLAVAFMLAYPYGYPMVMSSYRFEDDGQGPPDSSPLDDSSGCGHDWICEHRRPAITNMVAFRKAADGADVVNWHISDGKVVSFGRGDIGHVVINVSEQAIEIEVPTSLPTGRYCDVIANGVDGAECAQDQISVNDGVMIVSLQPLSAIAILAGD
ncbi:MAG: alpha-amylase family protein [Woeseiaceae bacterium]|nr:alpha-amylase family protein [Woeseiaceae bacterium]MDX2607395.1 alpha-amylase family protein [Woeseiaceae bacterium]